MNDFVLQIKDLDKSFGKSKILHKINLKIGKGDVYGLIGQNGAGKTTLLRLISGLMKPSGGNITIHTEKKYTGYMPQSCRFDDNNSVANTIRFFAALKKADVSDSYVLCEKLRLDMGKKVKHLSPGQQKKMQIVIAMTGDPDLYILDEPTAGLDPNAAFEMMEIIKSIHGRGKSIIVSSHIISDMDEICTNAAIIEKGKLVYDRRLEEGYEIKTSSVPFTIIDMLTQRYSLQTNESKTVLSINTDKNGISQLIKELTIHEISVFEVSAVNVKSVVQRQMRENRRMDNEYNM